MVIPDNTAAKERYAPYSRLEPVTKVIERIRERGLPVPMTSGTLEDMGIAHGNAYQVMQTLKFLKLVDEKGNLMEAYQQLHGASTDEYKNVLAGIIRNAYHGVFEIVDPAKDDAIRVNDAFRRYEPKGQRDRMVWLFLGLCRMAELAKPLDKTTRKPGQPRQARSSPPKPTPPKPPKDSPPEGGDPQDGGDTPPPPGNPPPRTNLDTSGVQPRYKVLLGMLEVLPADGVWDTDEEREGWLQAMSATAKVLTKVRAKAQKEEAI
jgi:hypothetical protein